MIIFPILTIVSIVLYIYYKVAIVRSNDPLIQEYTNSKAQLALGTFISVFGINQYLFYQTQLALFVVIVFLLFGGMQLVNGYKKAKHYRGELAKRIQAE
ncbi:YtpI family protein [Radiobacillus sp. PE A8.2]|uniref:YtpI family protein n=1 Tax=Radiobacillus sp. PE A8.2 TaxID=3380349 RepID=UPI00388E0E26